MRRIALLLAFSASLAALVACTRKQEVKSETEGILLKDYRPVSVFKVPEHSPTHPKFTVIDMHSHDYIEDEEGIRKWAALLDEQGIERVVINTIAHEEEVLQVPRQSSASSWLVDL